MLRRIPEKGTPDHERDGSWAGIDFVEAVMRIRLREGKRLYRSWVE